MSHNAVATKQVTFVESEEDARTRTYEAYTIRRKDGVKVRVPRSVSSLPSIILMRTRANTASIKGPRLVITVRSHDDWPSVHEGVMNIIDSTS